MAKSRGDFVDILLRNGTIGPDQLDEAERLASSTGVKLQEALVKSSYVTQAEVMQAIAEFHNLQFVNLEEVEIPKSVINIGTVPLALRVPSGMTSLVTVIFTVFCTPAIVNLASASTTCPVTTPGGILSTSAVMKPGELVGDLRAEYICASM